MNEVVVGIDIGSSKVCTIIAGLNKNEQLQILGVGTAEGKGLKKGIVVDIDSAAQSITSSVEQSERMAGMEVNSAYISIPGGYTSLTKNNGVIAVCGDKKEITPGDVERVLETVKADNVPVDMEVIGVIPIRFSVDGYENIKDPVGMTGVRLEAEAYVIAAPMTIVQNLYKSVERCNIKVTGIVIEPLASSEVVLSKDEKDLGVALVDVGGEITDISVFVGGNLVYTKLIPVGGMHITNDISIGLKLPVSEAEKLKRQYGCASVSMLDSNEDIRIESGSQGRKITNRELVDIMEARVQEICCLINRELESSGYKESISCGVVLTGGGLAPIKGAIESAASIIGLRVKADAPHYIGVANPIYSAAAGMVKCILSYRKHDIVKKYAADEDEVECAACQRKHKNEKSKSALEKIKGFFADFF